MERVALISNTKQLNMEMRNRPDITKRFKHVPFNTDKTDDFKEVFEKELKK